MAKFLYISSEYAIATTFQRKLPWFSRYPKSLLIQYTESQINHKCNKNVYSGTKKNNGLKMAPCAERRTVLIPISLSNLHRSTRLDKTVSSDSVSEAWGHLKYQLKYQKISLLHRHPFNGSLSGTTRVSRYQNGKTNMDFIEVRDSEWQWHQLGMQVCICTSLQTDNHASTPSLSFLQAGRPSCRPTNSVKALKALNTTDKEMKYNTLCFLTTSSLLCRSSLNSFFVSVCYKSSTGY